jgi:hypothetical protein
MRCPSYTNTRCSTGQVSIAIEVSNPEEKNADHLVPPPRPTYWVLPIQKISGSGGSLCICMKSSRNLENCSARVVPSTRSKEGKGKSRYCGAHSALPALKVDCTLAPEVVPSFISRGAPHQAAREASISKERKQNARILPTTRNFTAVGFFYMHQSWDMGQII